MKRGFIIGLFAAGMILCLVPRSFADDRGRGSSPGQTMGPRTAAQYYLYQHGQPPPVLPPSGEGICGTPLLRSRPGFPPSNGHYQIPFHQTPPEATGRAGHWKTTRVWIPERRQEVWIWGHVENGYWVNGHSEVLVYPGYYVERKVWIEGSGR